MNDGTWRISVGSGSQDLINKVSNGIESVEIDTNFDVFYQGIYRAHRGRRFYLIGDTSLLVSSQECQ